MTERSAFVIVANRLPVDEETTPAGRVWRRSPGGLVTALYPVVAARGGTWVGWAGGIGRRPEAVHVDGIRLHPVPLTAEDVANYYEGYRTRPCGRSTTTPSSRRSSTAAGGRRTCG